MGLWRQLAATLARRVRPQLEAAGVALVVVGIGKVEVATGTTPVRAHSPRRAATSPASRNADVRARV